MQETEVWINVKRINGKWFIGGTKALSFFESDWADGEPDNGQNKDCAYMSKDAGLYIIF